MTEKQFELHWQFSGNVKPVNISQARWNAMITSLMNKIKEEYEK